MPALFDATSTVGDNPAVNAASGTSAAPALSVAQQVAAAPLVFVTVPRGTRGAISPILITFDDIRYSVPLDRPVPVPQTVFELLQHAGYA